MKLRSSGLFLVVGIDKRFRAFKEKYVDFLLSDSHNLVNREKSPRPSPNTYAKEEFIYLKSLVLNFDFVDLFYGYLYDILDVFERCYGLFSKVSLDDIHSIRMDSGDSYLSCKPSSVFHIYNERRLD